jgi:MFS family permease
MNRFAGHLVALSNRNFRLLWIGQLISFTGSMMQNAALLWHVSLLVPQEQKAIALGLVGLIRVLPIIIFSIVGGVVADAINRRKLMIRTQSALTLATLTLALLTFNGLSSVWPLFVLTGLMAVAGAFDNPARQSLIPNLVPREHLPNAISLNSIMFELAAVWGPALGGWFVANLNIGWVYALNSLSYVAVIIALLRMRNLPTTGAGRQQISWSAAVEGLRFVFREPLIRSTMLLDFVANFFATATALMPIFAQDVLKVGAQGYGLLFAAPSLGAMVASLVMVRQAERTVRRGWILVWSVIVYCLAAIGFGLSQVFWLSFVCLALFGASDMVSTIFRNLIRQLNTPDHLRGRMTSVNMIFFMGGPQLGELEAGLVANFFGAPISVISGGVAALLSTLWVNHTTPSLRQHRRDDLPPAPQAQAAPAD